MKRRPARSGAAIRRKSPRVAPEREEVEARGEGFDLEGWPRYSAEAAASIGRALGCAFELHGAPA